MKWLKSYWLPLSVLALLVMVDMTFPASHALFPLALIMWFEFASFSLVCFTGLYSCTLTGNDRLKVRFLLGRVLRVMDAITLTWYLRLAVAFVMLLAGWKLTGLVYVSTVAIGLAIKDELKALRE
ncbi:DNZ54_00345 family protein [Citrobacter arsenatis]|uniref:DNZ54_00345 family protein n=1 Tax=Citrobacter arsenatis TaxID=2546350 RepID=UPI003D7F8225